MSADEWTTGAGTDAGAGEYADPSKLTGGDRLNEDDVELPNGMGRVRVRGLSRAEALEIQKVAASGTAVVERKMLALALVRPRMTEGKVREWQEAAPAGELEPVTDKVQELSGVSDDAAKLMYRRFDADPAQEFRSSTSDETGDDRGAATGDDD